mgnify:CR=1 FL=1
MNENLPRTLKVFVNLPGCGVLRLEAAALHTATTLAIQHINRHYIP